MFASLDGLKLHLYKRDQFDVQTTSDENDWISTLRECSP